MRQVHTGAVTIPASGLRTSAAVAVDHDLLQRQLGPTGQWRNARFYNEPGRGPPDYDLTRITDEFEQRATASQFAATFGTQFIVAHRTALTSRPRKLAPSCCPALPQPSSSRGK